MKTTTLITRLMSIGALTLAGSKAFARVMTAESQMSQVEIKSCSLNKEKCLTLRAEKSKGSSLKHLDVFFKPRILIYKQGKLVEEKDLQSAYLDYDNNKLVFIDTSKKDQILERAFNIETLLESRYVIR